MKSTLKTLVFLAACLPLAAQIGAPRIGAARYPDGSLHSVQGLPFSMIVADLPLQPAEAASFSDCGGLIAQNGAIRLLGADFSVLAEYPGGETPLLSIGREITSALAWLPGAHTLLHWNGSKFDVLVLAESDIEGSVTDVQFSGARQARLLVERPDQSVSAVTVSLRNGNLVSSEPLPGVRGYAFSQGSFVVFASQKELVADNLHGYRRSVAFPASDLVMERMSGNWLHLYSPSLQQNWALYLTQADLQLSLLPGLPDIRTTAALSNNAAGEKNK